MGARRSPGIVLLSAAIVCLSAAPGLCGGPTPTIDCEGTLAAWSHDVNMRQTMKDYDCRCTNGSRSSPVCTPLNSGSRGPTSSGSGGGGSKNRGPSNDQIVVQELQKYVDSMGKVNMQAVRQYQQEGLQNADEIHRQQQAALHAEEERRKQAAQEEEARRELGAMTVHTELLGMPVARGNNQMLEITSALDEDARKKQLAECPGISDKIARYENGIRHIDEVMAKNDRMVRDAEAVGAKAEEDLAKVKSDATAEALSMGLKSFVQTQKNLQNMKDMLDKMQGGRGGNFGQMSYDQIRQAQKWLDRGLSHGQDVIDLTEKSLEYRKTSTLRGNEGFASSSQAEKLKTALKDFNEKFMQDAGGWEFVGEHLAQAGGGAAGEIAFKSAVAGIKATAAGIGMKLSRDQLRGFNENQDKMALERYRLEQRIERLRADFVNNRCPVPAKAEASAAAPGR